MLKNRLKAMNTQNITPKSTPDHQPFSDKIGALSSFSSEQNFKSEVKGRNRLKNKKLQATPMSMVTTKHSIGSTPEHCFTKYYRPTSQKGTPKFFNAVMNQYLSRNEKIYSKSQNKSCEPKRSVKKYKPAYVPANKLSHTESELKSALSQINTKIKFEHLSKNLYRYGNKKYLLEKRKERVYARTGGGFVPISEIVKVSISKF